MNIGAIIGVVCAILIIVGVVVYISQDKSKSISAEVVNSNVSAAGAPAANATTPAGKGHLKLGETLKPGLSNAIYSKNTLYMILLLDNGEF